MHVTPVDPLDQRWENDHPTYRVFFWKRPGAEISAGWSSEEWELSEVDIEEVLTWADANAAGRSISVWVVHRDTEGLGLIRLAGVDRTAASTTSSS